MTKRNDGTSGARGVDERLARHGGLSYLEIPALAPRRSAAFYEHVAGWTLDERAPGDVRFSDATGHLIGRFVTGRETFPEPGLLPYIYVNDIDDAVKRVVSHGGEVVEGPTLEGDTFVSTVRDPAGNVIGLWQAVAI